MMTVKTIEISKEYNIPGSCTLTVYLREDDGEMSRYNHDLDAMICVPGGGYHFVAEREGEPIAMNFFAMGYQAFVVRYDVAPAVRYPVELTQLACCVDYVRKHAEAFHINPERIFAVGFSAGGHLLGNLCNFHTRLPQDYLAGKTIDAHLNGAILSYPVIRPDGHIGSFKNLLGKDSVTVEEAGELSLDTSVNADNPPCFVWTTAHDTCVKPSDTLRYALALQEAGIPFECHVFPTGGHGSATCNRYTIDYDLSRVKGASRWMKMADEFLQGLKK